MKLFQFECCGVNSGNDYSTSWWHLKELAAPHLTVPISCCFLDRKLTKSYLDPVPINLSSCQDVFVEKFHNSRHHEVRTLDNKGLSNFLQSTNRLNCSRVAILLWKTGYEIKKLQFYSLQSSTWLCNCWYCLPLFHLVFPTDKVRMMQIQTEGIHTWLTCLGEDIDQGLPSSFQSSAF